MRVNNQTSSPVDYEQTGGGGGEPEAVEPSQSGQLQPDQETPPFVPAGEAAYEVEFTNINKPSQTANSGPIDNANATVTLNDNWTVTVTP